MHNLMLVARREYLEQIRGRAFRVTTILIPALFGMVIAIMIAAGLGATSAKHVVVASNDAGLAEEVRAEMLAHNETQSQVDVVAPAGSSDRAVLVNMVRTGAIDGFLWVDTEPGKAPAAVYESQSSGDFITDERLNLDLNRALVRRRLSDSGVRSGEIDTILKDVDVDTRQINKQGRELKSNAMNSFWKGYVMAFLLSMTTMIYGMNVARSIIQEKASRIFEVMLAAARPTDLLAGKLIGVGAVGLTQIAIWFVAGTVLFSAFAGRIFGANLSIHLSWIEGLLFPVYFVLGYLLYASLFAGLAASCETEQELQMYTPLAALPIWLAFALILVAVNNPDSTLAIAASLFPATAPIVMMLRMGSQMPPAWQFGASIAIMMVSICAVLWVSSRLYRVGILMYGKRATFPELLRWLRYS